MARDTTDANLADIIFFGGNIITMDEEIPTAEAIAVKDGKIRAIGKLNDIMLMAGEETECVYLNKYTLMPGLIEIHQHPIYMALSGQLSVDIGSDYCKTLDEIIAKIKEKIDTIDPTVTPKQWATFIGWDPELVSNLPILSADYLDQFSTEVPIFIIARNLHSAWTNHVAMNIAKIDESSIPPPGGYFVKGKNGRPTGQFLEEPAIQLIGQSIPRPKPEEIFKLMINQFKIYSSKGFTTLAELCYSSTDKLDGLLSTVCNLVTCPVRLAVYRSNGSRVHTFPNSEKLWLAGIKFFADGSPHNGGMAVREPYLNTLVTEQLSFPPAPSYGKLIWDTQELFEKMKPYHEEGTQLAIHAHGERAVEQALNVYSKLITEPGNTVRHRIEHLGLATDSQIKFGINLGLSLSFFVYHLYYYGSSFRDNLLGSERTNRWCSLGTSVQCGGKISIHQDHPGIPGPIHPFANIKVAVTRKQHDDNITIYGADQRISIHEALKAYTVGPAWQLFKEDQIGSLSVGKYADLVILSDNPYTIDIDNIEKMKVVETYLAGRCNNLSTKSTLNMSHNIYCVDR